MKFIAMARQAHRQSHRPKSASPVGSVSLFREQCFISGDPDETTAPHTIAHVGADNFMWATDYPHPDHPHTWVDALTNFVEPLSADDRQKFLGENVKRIYKLT